MRQSNPGLPERFHRLPMAAVDLVRSVEPQRLRDAGDTHLPDVDTSLDFARNGQPDEIGHRPPLTSVPRADAGNPTISLHQSTTWPSNPPKRPRVRFMRKCCRPCKARVAAESPVPSSPLPSPKNRPKLDTRKNPGGIGAVMIH